MFSLHETTKMRLGLAAFVALCVLPTCAVLAWSVYVRTPAYRHAHERAIAEHTGWQATLERAASPRPGLYVYESLELCDRDTGQLLARLPFVEIDARGAQVAVKLPFPALVNGTRLDALADLTQQVTRSGPGLRPICVEAQNLTLHLVGGDLSFTDFVGQVDEHAGQTRARLSFKRATSGTTASEPCLVSLERRRAIPDQSVHLTTGSTPLPTMLLAAIWPDIETFGKDCHFAGRISASGKAGAWTAELAGQLSGLDLDLLVSRQFPHKLSGRADARIEAVEVRNGRIERAVGNLIAGPGVISRSLVQSAETHLHVQAGAEALRGANNLIAYQLLNVSFEVGPDGLSLRGTVPQTRGALLVDDHRVLAYESPLSAQPVVDLVRTLVPKSEVHVPATRETAALTARLPVPSIVPAPGSEEPLPHARAVNVNPLRSSRTILR